MSATLNLVPNLVNDLVGTHKDAFLVEVNRARNSQAHALHSNSRFHDQDGGLYFAAETLNWLLRVMLLIELGFTAEDAEQAVQGNSSFKFVAKWMKSFMANFAEMSTESQDEIRSAF